MYFMVEKSTTLVVTIFVQNALRTLISIMINNLQC